MNKVLEENSRDFLALVPKASKRLRCGQSSMHIVVRQPDCQHMYSLFFDLQENDFLHWVVNNGDFINDFIENYNLAAKDIISEVEVPENRIILLTYDELSKSASRALQIKIFHKHSHMSIYLSRQQSICLSYLMQGKSIKKIAAEMNLSPKTVMHYLERVRQILGCSSNLELVASYGDQFI